MPTSSGCSVVSSALRAIFGEATIDELHGGHQSSVFRVTRVSGEVIVAKLTDASMVDRAEFAARVAAVAALADIDGRVCRPLPIGDGLVNEVDDGGQLRLLVCHEHAAGVPLDASDADLMGRTLRGLHESMAELPAVGLPSVAALRGATDGEGQLLHGDFNAGNIRRLGEAVRIFDFDDCGYGPVAFDVANALYMVLFDAVVQGAPRVYLDFRQAFVGAFRHGARTEVSDAVLDGFIDRRVEAVRAWLDDLDRAPIGIRTASPQWHATLRSFTDTYRDVT